MNYKTDLIETILPFWLANAVDEKNGGIYTQLDATGVRKRIIVRKSRKKFCVSRWYSGRMKSFCIVSV